MYEDELGQEGKEEKVEDLFDLDVPGEDEVPPLGTVPHGTDCELVCTGVIYPTKGEDGSVKGPMKLILNFASERNIGAIFHTIWLPKPGDTEAQIERAKRNMRRVGIAFGVPKLTKEELVGKKTWAKIGRKEGSAYPTGDDGAENYVMNFG